MAALQPGAAVERAGRHAAAATRSACSTRPGTPTTGDGPAGRRGHRRSTGRPRPWSPPTGSARAVRRRSCSRPAASAVVPPIARARPARRRVPHPGRLPDDHRGGRTRAAARWWSAAGCSASRRPAGWPGAACRSPLVHRAGHLMDRQLDAGGRRGAGRDPRRPGRGQIRTGVQVAGSGDRRSGGRRLAGRRARRRPTWSCSPAGYGPVDRAGRATPGLEVGARRRRRRRAADRRPGDPRDRRVRRSTTAPSTAWSPPPGSRPRVVADLLTGDRRPPATAVRGMVTRLKARSVELAAMGETHLTERPDAEVVRFSHRARAPTASSSIRDGRLVGAILLGETRRGRHPHPALRPGGPLPGDRRGPAVPRPCRQRGRPTARSGCRTRRRSASATT